MSKIKIGDKAPDFNMSVGQDKTVSLLDYKGKYVILYFYPKDDTPGCTIEAKEFNDLKGEFAKLNAIIIGVSKDDLDSHNKFRDKYCLEFDLAFDDGAKVAAEYDSYGEKSMFGKKYMGVLRNTFLIDPSGMIEHIWTDVSASGHAREVMQKLKEFS